jgi:hypothetical protein
MRKLLISLMLLVPVGLAAASQSKTLSANFCSVALQAVRVIDSYTGTGSGGDAGDAVNAAQAAVHTQAEQNAMKALHAFLDDKLDNNVLRAQVMAKAVDTWKNSHANGPDSELDEVRTQALDHPGIREMTRREDDCAASMSRMLRGGVYREPERCDGVRLSRDAHAMQQYFPSGTLKP